MVRVLPVPAPAKMHTGPRGAVAATRSSSSSASKSNSKELTANTTPLITCARSNHSQEDLLHLTQSFPPNALQPILRHADQARSEERRVGKESRWRRSRGHKKKREREHGLDAN